MIRICLKVILLLMVAGNVLLAQNNPGIIKGHIRDAQSGDVLYNANVYISNTLIGASTDFDGYYEIKNVPPGTHELVITIIGYNYVSKRVWMKDNGRLTFDFKLQPVIYESNTIRVEADNPDKWKSDLADFKRIFFAQSPFASETSIKNPEVLDFSWHDDDIMNATARQPLIIENQALGFRIECILQEFAWDSHKQQWSWSIKPRFSELPTNDASRKNQWQRNRNEAYDGSLYHFLKALVHKQLGEEGFNIYFVDRIGEKISRMDFRNAVLDYKQLVKPGIIKSETVLDFNHVLFVVYKNAEYSWIRLNLQQVTLDENGYPADNFPFSVYGRWALQGAADLLPRYSDTAE